MAQRKSDKLTLDEVENMIKEGVLSRLLATYLRRWRVQRNQSSESSSDEDSEPQTKTANQTGRNGTYWRSDTPLPSGTRRHNILHEQPCPKRAVITSSSFSAFELFLSEDCRRGVQMHKLGKKESDN